MPWRSQERWRSGRDSHWCSTFVELEPASRGYADGVLEQSLPDLGEPDGKPFVLDDVIVLGTRFRLQLTTKQ